MDYRGKKVLILGFGRITGATAVEYLHRRGAEVRISDKLDKKALNRSLEKIKNIPAELYLGKEDPKALDKVDLVLVSPAIAPDHPFLALAQKRNIELTTEVNIFFEQCQGKIIGVIGTNGKETTVKLIASMLKNADKKVYIGGNIGSSLLPLLNKIDKSSFVVFELSSFQLNRLRWVKRRPDVAVYLNISPDHLDWHCNFEHYFKDKLVALEGQGKSSTAVINIDDPYLKTAVRQVEGRLIKTGFDCAAAQVCLDKGKITALENNQKIILAQGKMQVAGRHNLQNAISAAAAGWALGLGFEQINPAIAEFAASAHTLEFVGEINGVKYYNDSEATNPAATIAAVRSFNRPVHLILGGFDKQLDYCDLITAIVQSKVKSVATIGTLTDKLFNGLKSKRTDLQLFASRTLLSAVANLRSVAKKGDIILLSPAASSFDQFKNLEERGEKFKAIIRHAKL